MKKYIALILMAGALAACGPSEEAVRRVKSQLPPGCKFYDLGAYGQIDNLVMIRCSESQVTTNGAKGGKHSWSYSATVDG